MATFSERAAQSFYRTLSLYFLTYCNVSYSPFGFEGGTLVLIASVPGRCLYFTFYHIVIKYVCWNEVLNTTTYLPSFDKSRDELSNLF